MNTLIKEHPVAESNNVITSMDNLKGKVDYLEVKEREAVEVKQQLNELLKLYSIDSLEGYPVDYHLMIVPNHANDFYLFVREWNLADMEEVICNAVWMWRNQNMELFDLAHKRLIEKGKSDIRWAIAIEKVYPLTYPELN